MARFVLGLGFCLTMILVCSGQLTKTKYMTEAGAPALRCKEKPIDCFIQCENDDYCAGITVNPIDETCATVVCNVPDSPPIHYSRYDPPPPCCTLGFHTRGIQALTLNYNYIDRAGFPVAGQISHVEFYATRIRSLEFGLFRPHDATIDNPLIDVISFDPLPVVVGFNRVDFTPPIEVSAGDHYGVGWSSDSVLEWLGPNDTPLYWHSRSNPWPTAGVTIQTASGWGKGRLAFVVYYCAT